MTTYATAETALLTLTRAYSAGAVFTAANSSIEDWRVLDASGTNNAAVIEMAGKSIERMTVQAAYGDYGAYQEVHQIGVWLCVERSQGMGGDGAVKAACKALTEAYKDYMRPYRRLNNATGVRSAQIVSTTAPSFISPTRDVESATHVAQLVTFEIACESDAPAGEIDG
jgi:hypothetical protein